MVDGYVDSDVLLRCRVVDVDHYMTPPIPHLDYTHSLISGKPVSRVPVIRVFGTTPSGQKVCVHVHRVLPLLYVPLPTEEETTDDAVLDAFLDNFAQSLNRVLNIQEVIQKKKQKSVFICRPPNDNIRHPLSKH